MTTLTPPDGGRRALERAGRALALGALALAAWQAVRDRHDAATDAGRVRVTSVRVEAADHTDDRLRSVVAPLRAAVVARAARGGEDTLALSLSHVPRATVRGALSVLPLAGVPVRWVDSTGSRGLALAIAPAGGPRGGYVVRASAGPATQPLVLRDGGGLLDSLPAAAPAGVTAGRVDATWRIASIASPLEARVGGGRATVTLPDTLAPKRLLVMAQPGWESKFAVAALEETGWRVDGTLRVSPTGAVQLGVPQRPDTARYAAVLVLDSMAVDAAALSRFVTAGGGLVLALRPVRATALRGGVAGALLTASPRRGLEAWEFAVMPGRTVLLADTGEVTGEVTHAEPSVVVGRIGAGRVVAVAYRDTWRWRMQGTDDGAADHRAWWGDVVGAVAPDAARPARAAPAAEATAGPGDAAPYADLVAVLGAPSPAEAEASPPTAPTSRVPRGPSPALLFVAAALALLAEWSSRRLRGLR